MPTRIEKKASPPESGWIQGLVDRLDSLPRGAKKLVMVASDAVLIPFAFWLALSLRYGKPFTRMDEHWLLFVILTIASIAIFSKLNLYQAVIRFAGRSHALNLLIGIAISAAILLVGTLMNWPNGLPRSGFIIYAFVAFVLLGGSRIIARWLFDHFAGADRKNVLILGAGECGRQVVHMLRSGNEYHPLLFLDDDKRLANHFIEGLLVRSPDDPVLVELVRKKNVEVLFLAIPSASRMARRQLLQRVEHLPVHVYTVPPLRELMSGEASVAEMREVAIEDLLGREPIPPNDQLLAKCITNKSVMVTGAGGSIGAELCRQALELKPELLILFELSEFALFEIEQELHRSLQTWPGNPPRIVAVLGSVNDGELVSRCITAHAIDTIYHAAAYKHVPLVEHNPLAGIRNNVFGTLEVARRAAIHGVNNFVLISTDKAVRPTNVMGATKRVAEMIIQDLAEKYPEIKFSMVRFGNVLGSSGSVVPKFHEQIRNGGPVTVTSSEVTRFFMTISEAVQLVIQSGAMAKGGDVFVLDMGDPVRIYDLARQMIRLSGYEVRDESNPDGEIEIVVTGLRPGEKLYEELLIGSDVYGTDHPKILRAQESKLTSENLKEALDELDGICSKYEFAAATGILSRIVDDYRPTDANSAGRLDVSTSVSPVASIPDTKH